MSGHLHMTPLAHWRTCPVCKGEGVPLSQRCAGGCSGGDVTVWIDPIVLLRSARRGARFPGQPAMRYGEIRQRVVSPVLLPEDRAVAAWRAAA